MRLGEINNFFGDMDLFLMDAILKGHVPESGCVLDVGCGAGRNGLYFIRNGYSYTGIDQDDSQVKLIAYLAKSLTHSESNFFSEDIRTFELKNKFDIIVCSRVLHFAKNEADFAYIWNRLIEALANHGVIYLSMDSAIDNSLAKTQDDSTHVFPDGKLRFALTEDRYRKIKKGLEEIEPLKTVAHHNERAQSFVLLRKP